MTRGFVFYYGQQRSDFIVLKSKTQSHKIFYFVFYKFRELLDSIVLSTYEINLFMIKLRPWSVGPTTSRI